MRKGKKTVFDFFIITVVFPLLYLLVVYIKAEAVQYVSIAASLFNMNGSLYEYLQPTLSILKASEGN